MERLQRLQEAYIRRRLDRPKTKSMSPARWILLGFALIILLGTVLLCLPVATRSGQHTSPYLALFTATSATCITGMTLVDTWTHWSLFGQIVILTLVQIGGLGFMSFVATFSFFMRRRIGIRERMVMSASLNLDELSGVVRLTKRVVIATLFLEAIGAVLLSIQFIPQFGLQEGIYQGVFHSISAFCNSGFDIMGEIRPRSGLTSFVGDVPVTMTTSVLAILGGLGFYVWGDLASSLLDRGKRRKRLALHTKVVLIMSVVLIAFGTIAFLLCEYTNEATIGDMPFWQKLMVSYFHSVSYRTAGFVTVDLSAARETTTMIGCALMFIGGSPGSTSGGVKTTTVAVMMIAVHATLAGKTDMNLFHRRISRRTMRSAFTMFTLGIVISLGVAFFFMAVDGISTVPALYESIAAFSTTGISLGVTMQLSHFSQLCLLAEMFIGRVGVLTLGLGLMTRRMHESKYRYPDANIMVG
ncbi:MAG: potassium transporter TrkG [Eubacteriales bacterium]|nr:potassium transporter TrkG [Eubacteriales bacterium]